jgi:hypothetical protein
MDDHGFAQHVMAIHETPETAVGGVIAIVAHHEKFVLGNGYLRHVIPVVGSPLEFIFVKGGDTRGIELSEWRKFHRFAINIYPFIDNFYLLPLHRDTSLDIIGALAGIILTRIAGIFENDDISRFGIGNGGELDIGEWNNRIP